jgi:hypothetical protein
MLVLSMLLETEVAQKGIRHVAQWNESMTTHAGALVVTSYDKAI